MTKKKYAIFPGYLRNEDGIIRFVSGHELIRLYGLRLQDCVILSSTVSIVDGGFRTDSSLDLSEFVCLYPREDGGYSLPKDNEQEEETI